MVNMKTLTQEEEQRLFELVDENLTINNITNKINKEFKTKYARQTIIRKVEEILGKKWDEKSKKYICIETKITTIKKDDQDDNLPDKNTDSNHDNKQTLEVTEMSVQSTKASTNPTPEVELSKKNSDLGEDARNNEVPVGIILSSDSKNDDSKHDNEQTLEGKEMSVQGAEASITPTQEDELIKKNSDLEDNVSDDKAPVKDVFTSNNNDSSKSINNSNESLEDKDTPEVSDGLSCNEDNTNNQLASESKSSKLDYSDPITNILVTLHKGMEELKTSIKKLNSKVENLEVKLENLKEENESLVNVNEQLKEDFIRIYGANSNKLSINVDKTLLKRVEDYFKEINIEYKNKTVAVNTALLITLYKSNFK